MNTVGRTGIAIILATTFPPAYYWITPQRVDVDVAGFAVSWLAPPHVPSEPVAHDPKEDPFKELEGTWLRSRLQPSSGAKELWRIKWQGSEIQIRRMEASDSGERVPGKSEKVLIGIDVQKLGDTLSFRDSAEPKGYRYYELNLVLVSGGTVYGRVKYLPQKVDLPMQDEHFQLSRVQ